MKNKTYLLKSIIFIPFLILAFIFGFKYQTIIKTIQNRNLSTSTNIHPNNISSCEFNKGWQEKAHFNDLNNSLNCTTLTKNWKLYYSEDKQISYQLPPQYSQFNTAWTQGKVIGINHPVLGDFRLGINSYPIDNICNNLKFFKDFEFNETLKNGISKKILIGRDDKTIYIINDKSFVSITLETLNPKQYENASVYTSDRLLFKDSTFLCFLQTINLAKN